MAVCFIIYLMKSFYSRSLFITAAVLTLVGLLFLMSVSSVAGEEKFGDAFYFLKRQLLFGLLPGLILAYLAYRIPLSFWKKAALALLILNLILLALVFVPGFRLLENGAQRWLKIGPLSFQPSEFLKITILLFLASWLSSKSKHEINSFKKTILPFWVLIFLAGILVILEPATGNFVVIAASALVVLMVAGMTIRNLGISLALLAMIMALVVVSSPYRYERVLHFLNPSQDVSGLNKTYQSRQSLISVGSGGLLGVGFGKSQQKYNYLPESYSDLIFAIWAEESGFIGVFGVILAFLFLAFLGLGIAKKSGDNFSAYLAVGLTSWIVGQAFLNMAVSCSLLPIIGLPLPFFSAGGSILLVTLLSVGLLLNIAKNRL